MVQPARRITPFINALLRLTATNRLFPLTQQEYNHFVFFSPWLAAFW